MIFLPITSLLVRGKTFTSIFNSINLTLKTQVYKILIIPKLLKHAIERGI